MCKNVRLIELEIDKKIRAGLPVEPNDLEKLTATDRISILFPFCGGRRYANGTLREQRGYANESQRSRSVGFAQSVGECVKQRTQLCGVSIDDT
jgi:hypothetical protein